MAKLIIHFVFEEDSPKDFLDMIRQDNIYKRITRVRKELENNCSLNLVPFESDLKFEIVDEVQDD